MATSKKPNTVEIVTALAQPVLEEMGLELWDVRFEKEGASWYLRIFIDKVGGVNISDCEAVSKGLDKIMDEADPISQAYYFEVSSPGIGRELIKPWHLQKYMGEQVEVRLIRPLDGSQDRQGALLAADEESITIQVETNPEELRILKKDTAYIRLYEEL